MYMWNCEVFLFDACSLISNDSQAHPWFRGTQWDRLYEIEAAYKPTVIGDLDTQNFEKFPDVSSLRN